MAEVLLVALKDIIKYKIIQNVSTGDKTYDNLLQMFLLAALGLAMTLISMETFRNIKLYYMGWRRKSIPIDKFLIERVKTMSEDNQFSYSTWLTTNNTADFEQQLVAYVLEKIGWQFGTDRPRRFNVSTFKITGIYTSKSGSLQNLKRILKRDEHYPLYSTGRQVAGIIYSENSIMLFHNTNDAFDGMTKEIQKMKYGTDKEICRDSQSVPRIILPGYGYGSDDEDEEAERVYNMYPDRTMSMFISRHKPTILNQLQMFIKANKEGAQFGGLGPHNLGILLHGTSGSGKSYLVKCICNYLDRDAYIVDVSKVKTENQFAALFANPEEVAKRVYSFEEFDFIQGIIRDRAQDDTKDDVKDEVMEKLRTRQMQLLKLISERTDKKELSKKDPLQKQLDQVTKDIKKHESRLSLYTMLQVLDGLVEHRNRIIIATTNYIDRIDPALCRPGRFGLHINLSEFNHEETRELLEMMFKDTASKTALARLHRTKFPEGRYTPSKLIDMAVSASSLDALLDILK